ncbi:MAG: hypothetical protein HFJ33_03885 [Clostridia bacterium]|nr:hypothetical protein [Clostridia bacterium]
MINLEIYKNINSLVLVPDYLYHYRTNDSSITNQQNYESLQTRLSSVYKSHKEVVSIIDRYEDIQEKQKLKKIAIYRTIRGMKNRMIEFAYFGIQRGKEKEVFSEIQKILEREDFEELCQQITQKELLELAKNENHKYVIKNIYQKNTTKIIGYIKSIYRLGKKIKKIVGR